MRTYSLTAKTCVAALGFARRRAKRHSPWLVTEVASDARAGVQDALRVQRVLDAAVQRHGIWSQITLEPGMLEPSDPVFAGDRAAEIQGEIHDLPVRQLGPLAHRGVVGVVHDQRMGVA